MARLTIRETRDVALVAELDRQCFPADDPYQYHAAKWWLAYHGGRVIAYAGARYWPPDNAVFLCRAGTLPEGRGLGAQRALIRRRVAWARKISASCCYTYTVPSGARSARNLVRCRFLPWVPGVAWAGDGVCYWLLDLT
jgi:GNAT superfamily N-acetyltransferase